ncbi:unnamed protein product, partial [Symbiodinium sp. CCMP2456]
EACLASESPEDVFALHMGKLAGGSAAAASRHHSQAARFVVQNLARCYVGRGGRDLMHSSPEIRAAAKTVRKKKVLHARPKQMGSGRFMFLAAQLRQHAGKTKEQVLQEWKDLDSQTKQVWQARSNIQVRMQREAKSHAQESQQQAAVPTPWNLGDSNFPLTQRAMNDFLVMFRTKDAAITALNECDDENCRDFCKKVVEGQKYHSMDAAMTFSKATVFAQVRVEDEQATNILKADCKPASCVAQHPGFCKTRDAGQAAEVQSLLKLFPTCSCVLRCEARRPRRAPLVMYLRAVLGTKKPLRLFFAWLALPGVPVADGQCLVYSSERAKVPHNADFARLPPSCADVGNCSLWNQHEAALQLLKVADLKAWTFYQMDYTQHSLKNLVITGKLRDLGLAKVIATPAPAEAAPREDANIFDCPLLKPGKAAAGVGGGDGSDHDDEDDMLEERDEVLDQGVESNDDKSGSENERNFPFRRGHTEDVADNESNAGSAVSRGLGRTHGQSTDVTVLQRILGDRCLGCCALSFSG